MQSVENTINCYEAGSVTRYHTHPRFVHFSQSDAAHAWGVTALIIQLHPNPSRELLVAGVMHDTGERFAGDLPAPVKRAHPALAAQHAALETKLRSTTVHMGDYITTDEDGKWLKLADMLECIMFASLTVPEALSTPPWISLMDAIEEFAKHVTPLPAIDIRELMTTAEERRGFAELSGSFDYSKYGEQPS